MLNIYYIWCITIILTWLEVTESVTLPWKSTLIISILTFPSINCMQCFDKIPIIGGALSKTFVKPPLCFEDRWWTHLQCKYCFQMQRWQNCLDWSQLPFIDALFPHSLLQSTTDSVHWPLSMWGCNVVPTIAFLNFLSSSGTAATINQFLNCDEGPSLQIETVWTESGSISNIMSM